MAVVRREIQGSEQVLRIALCVVGTGIEYTGQ